MYQFHNHLGSEMIGFTQPLDYNSEMGLDEIIDVTNCINDFLELNTKTSVTFFELAYYPYNVT